MGDQPLGGGASRRKRDCSSKTVRICVRGSVLEVDGSCFPVASACVGSSDVSEASSIDRSSIS